MGYGWFQILVSGHLTTSIIELDNTMLANRLNHVKSLRDVNWQVV